MVEAYLISAKSNFEKFREILNSDGDNNNYQLYIPEKQSIIGYFENKKMDFSKKNFYESEMVYELIEPSYAKKLNKKIEKNKFVHKFNLENQLLENLILSKENLQSVRHLFRTNIENIKNSLNYSRY